MHSLFMATNTILFFLLLSAISTANAQHRQTNISRGTSLSPKTNSSWFSNSGLYAFGFYQVTNGYVVGVYLVGIQRNTLVWTANWDNPVVSGDATLLFTEDGRLILKTKQGSQSESDIYIATPNETPTSASMLDSGNFVLCNSAGKAIWQTFDNPTNTILQGQHLSSGKQLFSSMSETNPSRGIFRLAMQTDGNLVQYPAETPNTADYAYWASRTDGLGPNVTLKLDEDGHLYLLNETGNYVNNLTAGYPTGGSEIYLMRLDSDGIFRLYSIMIEDNSKSSILYSSTADKCAPKGLCGLNGYCINIDQGADCRCLPGFEPVKQGNWTSGCERSFNSESCKSKNFTAQYAMVPVVNTRWEDVSYEVLQLPTREKCQETCLEDCACEAVIFNEGKCKKMRLPLRYGRRNLNDRSILVVKMGVPSRQKLVDMAKQDNEALHRGIVISSTLFAAFAVIILGVSAFTIHRFRTRAYQQITSIPSGELKDDVAPRSFSYADLEIMTNNFSEPVGQGAFGTVFKGVTTDGKMAVAIKKLEKLVAESEKEFQTEIKIIGRTHHRNLVRLLGYCLEGPHRLLVFEYMSNGSLADVLHTPERQPCWDERIRIARDIARGILYLHEECEPQIIHCDIKPHNILMDGKGCPKISDFGLAKLLKQDQTKTFTGIRGTKGYVAPEWHKNLPVTVKADVYSFGIVLLEIISCRKSLDWSLPEEEAVLEDWVYDCFQAGETDKLVGDEEVNKKQLERMVKAGLWCILDDPSLRPSMKKVLLMLEGTVDIPIPPCPSFFLSSTS